MTRGKQEQLTDSQVEFYKSNYGFIIAIIELAYQELILCADLEGLQWLRSNLHRLGREARIDIKKIHSDIL